MITLWNLIFYQPLYNSLVWLVDTIPSNSLFLAVIILTIVVRVIISPLSFKAIRTQIKTKTIQPKLRALKKIKDKQEQAKQTLEIYKEEGINPFSSFALILVQFPIIIALYWVFREGGVEIDPETLYSFISVPENINLTSFGFDLAQKSMILAFLTGMTQYIHISNSTSFSQMEALMMQQNKKR